MKINCVIQSCSSTNDELKNLLINKKCKNGDWIRALSQTSGRGRQGRNWESQLGGFYFSHVLKVEQSSLITWAPHFIGIKVIKALIECGFTAEIKLKWPNDIYLNGKKTGGILCESISVDGVRYLVAGIGLNVLKAPTHIDRDAGFLLSKHCNPTLGEAEAYCKKIQEFYLSKIVVDFLSEISDEFSKTKKEFEYFSLFKKDDNLTLLRNGREMRVSWCHVNPDGSALVKNELGITESIYSEDIHITETEVFLKGD